jgi:hypothetical protein
VVARVRAGYRVALQLLETGRATRYPARTRATTGAPTAERGGAYGTADPGAAVGVLWFVRRDTIRVTRASLDGADSARAGQAVTAVADVVTALVPGRDPTGPVRQTFWLAGTPRMVVRRETVYDAAPDQVHEDVLVGYRTSPVAQAP